MGKFIRVYRHTKTYRVLVQHTGVAYVDAYSADEALKIANNTDIHVDWDKGFEAVSADEAEI